MALSGRFEKTYNTHWKIRLDWWASQDVASNSSTIYTDLFLIGVDGYSRIDAQQTKSGYISIHSTSSNFSRVPNLNPYEEKYLASHQATYTHDVNGNFECDIWGNFALQISGVGTVFETGGHIVLNTIPRTSTISNSPSYTMFNKMALNINRASTNFTHTAKVYVDGTWIKTVTGIGASTEIGMSLDENTTILQKMNGSSSIGVTVELLTYNGGTYIGTTTKSGTITAPNRNTATHSGNFYVGNTISGTIYKGWDSTNITSTVQLIFNGGSNVFNILIGSSGTSWSYNTYNIRTSLYNLMGSSNYVDGYIRVVSYYNDEIIRTPVNYPVRVYAEGGSGSSPTFGSNGVTFKDSNSTTVGVTGNNQYIIQNKSTLEVTIPSAYRATANDGATMSRYEITVNGVTETVNYSTNTLVVNFGKIDSSYNVSIVVDAIDSRGNYTRVIKGVNVVPYSAPSMTVVANRSQDLTSSIVPLSAYGSVSPININGSNKNQIISITYQYKQKTSSSYNSATSFTVSGFPSYSTNTVNLTLNNAYEWYIYIVIKDKIGSYFSLRLVSAGKPIFYIDSEKSSVSVNKVPTYSDSFEVGGDITATGDILADGGVGGTYIAIAPNSSYPIVLGQDSSTPTMPRFNNSNGYVGFNIQSGHIEVKTDRSGIRLLNNSGYYLNVNPSSSYTSLSTNSNRIDFDSPVSFYSGFNLTSGNTADFQGDLKFSSSRKAEVTGIGNAMAWYGEDSSYWNGGTSGNKNWVIAQIYNFYPNMSNKIRVNQSISWRKPFPNRVLMTMGQPFDGNSTAYAVRAMNRTTTGCDAWCTHMQGISVSGVGTIESHILAIGY